MSSLNIHLFGHMRIIPPGATAPLKLQHTTQSLFACLLLQPRHLFSRDQILDLFWGEQSEQRARNCLSTALWRLRAVLEPQGVGRNAYLLTTDAGEVGFNWDSDYWLDVERFAAAVEPVLQIPVQELQIDHASTIERALPLYQGELLEDFYAEWALRARERLRRLHLNSLAHLMHYYTHHQEYVKGLTYGGQILELDPLREEIHRHMMHLYAESGQRAEAVRQYENCRRILRKELDIPPMDETVALYRQIAADRGCLDTGRRPDARTRQQALAELQIAIRRVESAQDQLMYAIGLVKALYPEQETP